MDYSQFDIELTPSAGAEPTTPAVTQQDTIPDATVVPNQPQQPDETQPELVLTATNLNDNKNKSFNMGERIDEYMALGLSRQTAEQRTRDDFRKNHGMESPFFDTETMQKGISATMAGGYQMALDALKVLLPEGTADDESNLNQRVIKQLNAELDGVEKVAGTSEDWFTPANVGRLIPTLATLPVSASSRIAAIALEGAAGYGYERGSGGTPTASLVSGALSSLGTYGTLKLFDLIESRGLNAGQKVLNRVKEEFEIAPADEQKIYRKYATFTGKDIKDLTNYDKTTAIVMQSKEVGGAYIEAMVKGDNSVAKIIEEFKSSKATSIDKAIGKGRVGAAIKPIAQQKAFSSQSYDRFKSILFSNGPREVQFNRQPFIEAINDIAPVNRTGAMNRALRDLEADKPMTMEDLFTIREDLNGVTMRARKVDSKTANTIDARKYMDEIITQQIPDNFQPLWGKLKNELALKYAMSGKNTKSEFNNAFGELLSEAFDGRRSMTSILESVADAAGSKSKEKGAEVMRELMRTIGTENQKKFEKGLVREIYNLKDQDLGKLVQQVRGVDFVTPEGKHLKYQLKQLDDAFSSDDFYSTALGILESRNMPKDASVLTNNLLMKAQYAAASSAWKWALALPVSDHGKVLWHMKGVIKAMKQANPKIRELPELTPDMYKSFQNNVVRRSIEDTINTELDGLERAYGTKLLEYKPGSIALYGTEKGTVGTDMSETILAENMSEYVSKHIAEIAPQRANESDAIANSFEKVLTDSRVSKAIKSWELRNKGQKFNTRARETAELINREAQNVINRIQADMGIKVPTAEAKKIVQYKFDKIMGAE